MNDSTFLIDSMSVDLHQHLMIVGWPRASKEGTPKGSSMMAITMMMVNGYTINMHDDDII